MLDVTIGRREQLWKLLGRLPERHRPVTATLVSSQFRDTYVLEEFLLDLNGLEAVPAFFVRPALARSSAPRPAILYHHVHGGEYATGKEELTDGWRGLQPLPYAVELTKRGWSALCIDAWNFGGRHRRTESSLFKEMLWKGQVLWGMMMYDAVRALDYLVSRSEVDPQRVATIGMSMGSTTAWWLAALDERVAACVDLCCLTDYQALIEGEGLDQHGLYYYVPDLLEHFTSAEINELIAPRPHLSVAGELDPLTPPGGLDRIDAHLRLAYARAGASQNWNLRRYRCGHLETPEMRKEALKWLEKHLEK